MHDPTIPTAITGFRVGTPAGGVLPARHDVEREPATGTACTTVALHAVLRAAQDATCTAVLLLPGTVDDDAAAAWAVRAGQRAAGADVAVVTTGPVTDAMKAVDADGVIEGSVDREALRWARTPALLPVDALLDALRAAEAAGEPVVDAVGLLAGRVAILVADPVV